MNPTNTLGRSSKKAPAPSPVIGLLDHMGFGNLGDAAIFESFVTNIKSRMPDVNLVAFSANPEDTKLRHKIESYSIRKSNPCEQDTSASRGASLDTWPRAILERTILADKSVNTIVRRIRGLFGELTHTGASYRRLRKLNILIVAGGGQLCDLWHDQPYNIFKFCLLAKLSNRPVYIFGVGADRLKSRRGKLFARWAVALSDQTCFRDKESQALIRSLGSSKATHVCPDPAFGMTIGEGYRGPRRLEPPYTVGLNPMGFCDPRAWPQPDPDAYERYLGKLNLFVQWLLANEYNVELFSSDAGVDRYAMDDLLVRIHSAIPPEVHSRVSSYVAACVDDLLAQLSRFKIVVTPKFHGVVFSYILGKPVVAISYMPKINYLMQSAGNSAMCLEIGDFTVERLTMAFVTAATKSQEIEERVLKVAERNRDDLGKYFDYLCREAGRETIVRHTRATIAVSAEKV